MSPRRAVVNAMRRRRPHSGDSHWARSSCGRVRRSAQGQERKGLPVPQRRGPGQRHGNGERSIRAVRRRPPAGGLRGLRGRRAAGGDLLLQRARAGEPRYRRRHERQHGGREDRRRRASALDRFLFDLLDPDDEIFLYRFSDQPDLVETWTTDRRRLSRALAGLTPRGGTALYDTVAEAVPLAQTGEHRKKALVMISDGNDTNSQTSVRSLEATRARDRSARLRGRHRRAGRHDVDRGGGGGMPRPRAPIPFPFPIPGRRAAASGRAFPRRSRPRRAGWTQSTWDRDDRVNVAALRELTDDSGGRTEVVREARDLDRRRPTSPTS